VRRSVDDLLAEARAGLDRLTPAQAWELVQSGAVLVDMRPEHQRRTTGEVPGAVVIDRNVLEWRLDPASEACLPQASYDAHVVLLCQQGYSSSLAAATLQRIGITRATDVEGGFEQWVADGLPIVRPPLVRR
jgi:rhodanese-related sulfurtransferase